jgi:hypothetical protein
LVTADGRNASRNVSRLTWNSTTSVHAFPDPSAVLTCYCNITVTANLFALHGQVTRQRNPQCGVIFCQVTRTSQLVHRHKHGKILRLFTVSFDMSVRKKGTVTLKGLMAQMRCYFFISW